MHSTIQSPGKVSSSRGRPGAAGHWKFFAGTFVATWTVSADSRTTWPTSSSLWPSPVDERGVDEVDAELDRAAQGAERLVVVGADPHRPADPPGPVAELRDLEAVLPSVR